MTAKDQFRIIIERRINTSVLRVFDRNVSAANSPTQAALLEAYSRTTKELGRAHIELDEGERQQLNAVGVTWSLSRWAIDDLGRIVILLSAAERLVPEHTEDLLETLFMTGDTRERQALLRALPLLHQSDRLVALGVEACRSSVQPIFEAIACENPYPASNFPDANFDQMILKALFIGVSLERVVGLDARISPELKRMASDYASERRAAGRSVPHDISRIIGETDMHATTGETI
jgi:hypothetical protein